MQLEAAREAAKHLLRNMYRQRDVLWPGENRPAHEMIEPAAAARLLGVDFEYVPDLGRFGYKGQRFEVAGVLDRPRQLIRVSLNLSPETALFTAAHEIGHWTLHDGMTMHRDRPVEGLAGRGRREPQEAEADHFAACFLMPAGLVEQAVKARFGNRLPIVINETFAFHLCGKNANSLLNADSDSLDREFAIAKCQLFAMRPFSSLAQQFRVSVTSMAIRLRELQLVLA